MSPLPLIIVNPASAAGATGRAWAGIASDWRTHFGAFKCVFTEKTGDGQRLAIRAAQEGCNFIIACGGDGTISEVANGILESGLDVELGVLPNGTGGDFRRTLQLPTRAINVARSLRVGRTRRIDVGRAIYTNHCGTQESKYFLGVASFGMSREVIERVKDGTTDWFTTVIPSGSLRGKISFAIAALQTKLAAPYTEAFIKMDEQPERRLMFDNLCVANARYFGGGMKIAPQAKLNDGLFDIIAIGDLRAREILTGAPRLYMGAHLNMKQVQHARAARISARPARRDDEIQIEVDGELPGKLPATFEIIPRALRIRLPQNQ
jgi:YegS/Rv2252/BmrU family lipid kinase